MIRRREFITLLGGAAAAWPLAASAQPGGRVRRIGVLMPYDENDPAIKLRVSAFTKAVVELGWTDRRNVLMDLRWAGGDTNRIRALAQELVRLQPDIILTDSTPATAALQRETRAIPIVFANLSGPVGSGFVRGLNQPGGNITGFSNFEAPLAGKWLELLSEIAPGGNKSPRYGFRGRRRQILRDQSAYTRKTGGETLECVSPLRKTIRKCLHSDPPGVGWRRLASAGVGWRAGLHP